MRRLFPQAGRSPPKLLRTVQRLDLTRKVLKREAAQKDKYLRARFNADIAAFAPEQLVYIDEAVVNEKSMNRRYSLSKKGQAAIVREPLRHSVRWSVLPAYTIDRYLPEALITQSSVNGELFNEWLEHSLLL
ncbi:hypothetical protein ANO11243_091390 [Dothideomycetidae sp. 11243]|nr:hypothetical protein ANO11243_091390 [fungal sp. No.11243]